LGVVAAALAYVVVNTVLIAVAIGLSRHTTAPRELVGRWDDNALEVATLCLGALAAVALEQAPYLAALALPPILVLHRAVRVRHLEEVASIDGKTGLLNATTWQARADRAAAAARRAGFCAGVLIVDLDHFKAVNDEHGHLAGDDVLAAVARALRSGVRNQDLVGRFGGEEFVVLVEDLPAGFAGRVELAAVAERLRRLVARLTVQAADGAMIDGLSASVGGACVGVDPSGRDGDLDRALRAADACLYAAKRGGRDRVRIAGDVAEDVSGGVEVPAPRAAGDVRRRAASGAETVP
jgi:diguanylate cyclase (GGDEF)-like protein